MKRRRCLCFSCVCGTHLVSMSLVIIVLLSINYVKYIECEVPKILVQPNDVIILEGDAAELSCEADGEPEVQIEWFCGETGLPVRQTSTRTTLGGSIQFLGVKRRKNIGQKTSIDDKNKNKNKNKKIEELNNNQDDDYDEGTYWCVARNEFGFARSRNASLQVACK